MNCCHVYIILCLHIHIIFMVMFTVVTIENHRYLSAWKSIVIASGVIVSLSIRTIRSDPSRNELTTRPGLRCQPSSVQYKRLEYNEIIRF